MKFVLLAEGPTEQALPNFLKRWLDPRLSQRVGIDLFSLGGWRNVIRESPGMTRLHLRKNNVIGVIALLDLYGPDMYPADKTSPSERVEWAKKHLEARVGEPKFRQFFAVHETEAWLLSEPDIFPREVGEALRRKSQFPENVNFDEPPSVFLERLYTKVRKRGYVKPMDGNVLFKKLDPKIAYEKCPYLKELLDEMLKMAKDAGL